MLVCFRHSNRSSPGWILQSLEPQFAFRVERDRHFVFTQDLQSEREMPHTNPVASWRPRKGDRVLRLSLHSQPARRWGKRSTTVCSNHTHQGVVKTMSSPFKKEFQDVDLLTFKQNGEELPLSSHRCATQHRHKAFSVSQRGQEGTSRSFEVHFLCN